MVHRGNWKSNFYRAGVIQRADQLILKVLSFLPLAEGGPGFLRHRSAPGAAVLAFFVRACRFVNAYPTGVYFPL